MVVTAALASVAVPVCTSGHPTARRPGRHAGREIRHHAGQQTAQQIRYRSGHPADRRAEWPAGPARPAPLALPASHQGPGEAGPGHARLTAFAAPTIGLLSNTTAAEGVPQSVAADARHIRGSDVPRLASGPWLYLPDGRTASARVAPGHPPARQQIERSRAWPASGRVPGKTSEQRATAERALPAMRALLRPNGAVAAGWSPGWMYSWPRDSSFAAAALAHTGHDAEAHRILRYSAATQREDGTWEARTKLDGSGPPDARSRQLDANGWVPWATWQWYRTPPRGHPPGQAGRPLPDDPQSGRPRGRLPAGGRAAPGVARLLGADDVHREHRYGRTAARRAQRLRRPRPGDEPATGRGPLSRAARRLSAGITTRFLPLGYQRTTDGRHGHDSAVAFMALPFNEAPAALPAALDATYRELLLPNGGLTPGNDPGARWGALGRVRLDTQYGLLRPRPRLGRHGPAREGVTGPGLGALQAELARRAAGEGGRGGPALVGRPLAWTGSIVVLSLVALDGTVLPTPPLRP